MKTPLRFLQGRKPGTEGNVLLVALMIMILLVALATAQFAVVSKNARASSFYVSYSDLHKYAENGITLALHDLGYDVTGNNGNLGTVSWVPDNDVGHDGMGGTGDDGEGDGIPTVGEPNVYPVPVGPYEAGAGFIVHVSATGFPDIFRGISTASSGDGSVTVETYIRRQQAVVPRVGAVYVDPEVALDLKGGRFIIDGRDHRPDGTLLPEDPQHGISTLPGDPVGTNLSMLLAQISSGYFDQIQGLGGTPSVGELTYWFSLGSLFDGFKAIMTHDVAPATYTDPDFGTYSTEDFHISYCKGDLHVSGTGKGAGVLLVDGSLQVTGQFTYHGLIIVRGDVILSGGGSRIHTLGSVMVGQSLTAVDYIGTEEETAVTVAGQADLYYCSPILRSLEAKLQDTYSVVYYDEK